MVNNLRFYSLLLMLATTPHSVANVSNVTQKQQEAINKGTELLTPEFIDAMTQQYSQTALTSTSKELNSSQNITPIEYKILVSNSMGEERLLLLMKQLSNQNNVSLVIQGMLPNERTLNDVFKRIGLIVAKLDSKNIPSITLDPRPFEEVNAKSVPQILAYQDDVLIASAIGLANPKYIQERINEGKTGFLGNFGTTYPIAERNLNNILKERTAQLDHEKIINDAKNNYWDNVSFFALPRATETKTRTFAPIIAIQEDIIGNGVVIAPKGTLINTLEKLPFTKRLVIFDATDPVELAFVQSLPTTDKETKYITTRFDRNLKWDAVRSVENALNASVYLLNRDVITAFNVQKTPSVITADNQKNHFVINEYELKRNINNAGGEVNYE